jgi:hypothetical protein
MWKVLVVVFFSCFSLLGAYAEQPQFLVPTQIMITNNGFVINVDGQLYPAETITYSGNGLYSTSVEYYGSCRKCGWALEKDGRCPNQNCNGYGPRQD